MAAFAQQAFDVVPGARADLFELCAAVTDDDLLLALTLDEDGAIDAHEVCALLVKLFGDDRRHVGKLIARRLQNLFAHDFSDHRAQWLIRQLVFIEEARAFRQILHHLREQDFNHVALQRRDWHNSAPVVLLPVPLH